jgi:SAM-dependent methyltransferase
MSTSQHTVQQWFDNVYATRGLSYLRPAEAYPIFVHLVGAQPGERLLDVACGAGLLLRAARERGVHAIGVDLSRVAARLAGGGASVGNAELLPYRDESFDCITCIGSLERMIDREAVLREMQRVARPGARFCVMVRNSRTLTWKLARPNVAGHQDAAGLEQWTMMFERLGFVVDGIHPDQWFRQRLRRAFGISWAAQEGVIAEPMLVPLRYANEFIYRLRLRA